MAGCAEVTADRQVKQTIPFVPLQTGAIAHFGCSQLPIDCRSPEDFVE